MIWWRDTPDGPELKFALKGSEWLVLVEGDEREYRGGDLRVVLADAVGASASEPWLVALADQVAADAPPLEI